jgi:hypothetical protein
MAWIIGDSFDFYSAVGDAAGLWDSSAGWAIGTKTRFNVGKSINNTNYGGTPLVKTIGSNEATLFAAVAFYRDAALSGNNAEWGLQFLDGSTAQCTVVFESNGNITLRSGGLGGSVLATYANAYTSQTWAHFQIKVMINNTTGSISIRKDGATSDSFVATGLNTRGGTSNNYATKVAVASANTASTSYYFDDLLFYSAPGAAPNDWVGDIRAVQLMPNADTGQKQFTAGPTAQTFGYAGVTSTKNGSANTIALVPAAASASGTMAKITVNFNASLPVMRSARSTHSTAGEPRPARCWRPVPK